MNSQVHLITKVQEELLLFLIDALIHADVQPDRDDVGVRERRLLNHVFLWTHIN